MLPLYFISGIFIPPSTLPPWLQQHREGLPRSAPRSRAAATPSSRTSTGIGIVWSDLGALAIWAAIGLAVALRRFSWLPKAASA